MLDERANGREAVEIGERERLVDLLAQSPVHLDDQQGVPAQIEEAVVGADVLELEDGLPGVGLADLVAAELDALGVTQVDGRIIADESRYKGERDYTEETVVTDELDEMAARAHASD